MPQPVLCGNVGEQHPHIAAADHADVVRVAAVELVVPDVAVTGFQKLPGVKDGKIFHIAAADGARLGPLGIHQHLCAGTPGSGAGFPNDGRQNGVTALFHFIQQFCKDRLHADHPLLFVHSWHLFYTVFGKETTQFVRPCRIIAPSSGLFCCAEARGMIGWIKKE